MSDGTSWIELQSGTHFYVDAPNPGKIHLSDIAHALAFQCRFTGHSRDFYSVAEHSVVGSRLISGDILIRKAFLLHDAAEAFLGDMAYPVKRLFPEFRVLEERVQDAIHTRFGLDLDPLTYELVKEMDINMLATEADQLLPSRGVGWNRGGDILPVTLSCWNPIRAAAEFSLAASALGLS